MGVEYALRFASPGLDAVATVLRRLSAARDLPPPGLGLELRSDSSSSGMPDALVQPEPYGAYFCDNGGHVREFLGLVVSRLVSAFGPVTVAELE
jgi:hypothetical protein